MNFVIFSGPSEILGLQVSPTPVPPPPKKMFGLLSFLVDLLNFCVSGSLPSYHHPKFGLWCGRMHTGASSRELRLKRLKVHLKIWFLSLYDWTAGNWNTCLTSTIQEKNGLTCPMDTRNIGTPLNFLLKAKDRTKDLYDTSWKLCGLFFRPSKILHHLELHLSLRINDRPVCVPQS